MMIILKYARILVEIFFSCANDEYYVNALSPESSPRGDKFFEELNIF